MDQLVGLRVRVDRVLLPLFTRLVLRQVSVILEESLVLLFGHRRDVREGLALHCIFVNVDPV